MSNVTIYYDGDCPFCSKYVHYLRLSESVGEPRLVNVRGDAATLALLRERGLDLDQGMAVVLDDQWYDGDRAVNVLAGLSTASNWFNRLNRTLLSSPHAARIAYPLLRAGRNAALFLLGRERLTPELPPSFAPMVLFNAVWGLFAILHAISYSLFFNSKIYPTTPVIGLLGLLLFLHPQNMRVFGALLVIQVADAWLQMPLGSNHTVIKNFLLLAMLAAGAWQWLRGGRWSHFYNDFAPAGRVLLLVMYVFGIFHKINRDFLDPSVSCAVALWQEMPWPLNAIDSPGMHSLAIYGTFVVEGLILLSLLIRRTRHIGIGFGIAFHSLLGLSGYAMYPQFSTLTVALHLLFIERAAASKIVESEAWQSSMSWLRSLRGVALLIGWTALMTGLAWTGSYSQLAIVWLPSMLAVAGVCFVYGRVPGTTSGIGTLAWSRMWVVNLVSILFVLNGAAPYLGLKTAQSINMFANLQLEGGPSNHLLFKDPPGPFNYLDDVVTVTESSGSSLLTYVQAGNLGLTRYHLLDHLDRNPSATVSFELDGKRYTHQNSQTLAPEIASMLHPRWFRNWFHFNLVDLARPKPCALDR